MSKPTERILEILKKNPKEGFTTMELSYIIQRCQEGTRRHLTKLKELGLVRIDNSGRVWKWKVVKE